MYLKESLTYEDQKTNPHSNANDRKFECKFPLRTSLTWHIKRHRHTYQLKSFKSVLQSIIKLTKLIMTFQKYIYVLACLYLFTVFDNVLADEGKRQTSVRI